MTDLLLLVFYQTRSQSRRLPSCQLPEVVIESPVEIDFAGNARFSRRIWGPHKSPVIDLLSEINLTFVFSPASGFSRSQPNVELRHYRKVGISVKGRARDKVCDSDSVGNATFETQQGPGTPEIGVYDQGQSINETSNITRAVGSIDLFA